MKHLPKLNLAVLFILCHHVLVAQTEVPAISSDNPATQKYTVEILQDSLPVDIIHDVVQLEKKEFQLRITLNDLDGVFMSASFHRNYFDLAPNEEIKDYQWLNQKTRAEEAFNNEKELAVDDESVSYLFYDTTMSWHRFDKEIVVNDSQVIGTKTIDHIGIDATNENIRLKDMKADIYLFFVATEPWKEDTVPKELGRQKIQIKWKQSNNIADTD